MRHVAVIATGGTIQNTVNGRVSVESILDELEATHPDDHPRLHAALSIREVSRRGAETFTPEDWLKIAQAVQEAADRDDVDGIVVTHGNFTAEETAYFLHLTVHTEKPVVMACSQRKHGTIGNDGDRNLIDAVRLAASDLGRGLGVTVVLNEEIHSAREVRKTSRRPSGFHSDHSGVLGTFSEDAIAIYRIPARRHTHRSEFSVPVGPLPRVDIVATYAGADGAAVEGVLSAGARGIVVNGFSYSGKPHENQRSALLRAVSQGVPVVLVNRGGDGRIPVPGDAGDGFVRGDNLTAEKARVLLALALARTTDQAELQRIFSEY